MTIMPTKSRGTGLGNALAQLASGMQANQRERDFNRVWAANPELVAPQGYLGALQDIEQQDMLRRREAEELRKREALRGFSERIGGINPDEQGSLDRTLAEYGAITGDPSALVDLLSKRELARSGVNAPAALKTTAWYESATPEQREIYDRVNKVGTDRIDTGDEILVTDKVSGAVLARIPKKLAPSELPETKAAQEQAVLEARYMEEGRQKLPLQQRSLASSNLKQEFLDPKIEDIDSRISGMTAGWVGALSSVAPSSPAFDLKRDIETLLANAGFDRLQEMRDNSVTGGALGQVSEREIALLQAASQNLLNSQSPDQLRKNLRAFQEQRRISLKNIRDAYEQDYKRFGGEGDPYLPTPEATNAPQRQETGKTLDWGGEW